MLLIVAGCGGRCGESPATKTATNTDADANPATTQKVAKPEQGTGAREKEPTHANASPDAAASQRSPEELAHIARLHREAWQALRDMPDAAIGRGAYAGPLSPDWPGATLLLAQHGKTIQVSMYGLFVFSGWTPAQDIKHENGTLTFSALGRAQQ